MRQLDPFNFKLSGDLARGRQLLSLARTQGGFLRAMIGNLPFGRLRKQYPDGSEIDVTYHYGQYVARIFVPGGGEGVLQLLHRFVYRILPPGADGNYYNEWHYNDALFSGQSTGPDHGTTGRVFRAQPRWNVAEEDNRLRGGAYTWYPKNWTTAQQIPQGAEFSVRPAVSIAWEGSSKYVGGYAEWAIFCGGRFLCYGPVSAWRMSAAAVQGGWLMLLDVRNNRTKSLWIRPFKYPAINSEYSPPFATVKPYPNDTDWSNLYDADTNPDGWRQFPISGIDDDLYREYGRFNSTGTQAALVYLSETHSGYYTIDIDIRVEDGEPSVTVGVSRNDVFAAATLTTEKGYRSPNSRHPGPLPGEDFSYWTAADARHDAPRLGPLEHSIDPRETPLFDDPFFTGPAAAIYRGEGYLSLSRASCSLGGLGCRGNLADESTSFSDITSTDGMSIDIGQYTNLGNTWLEEGVAIMEANSPPYPDPDPQFLDGSPGWQLANKGIDEWVYQDSGYVHPVWSLGSSSVFANFNGLIDRRTYVYDLPDTVLGDFGTTLSYGAITYHSDTGPPSRIPRRAYFQTTSDDDNKIVVFADYVVGGDGVEALQYAWVETTINNTTDIYLVENRREEYRQGNNNPGWPEVDSHEVFFSLSYTNHETLSVNQRSVMQTTTGLSLDLSNKQYTRSMVSNMQDIRLGAVFNDAANVPDLDPAYLRRKLGVMIHADLAIEAHTERSIIEVDMGRNTAVYLEQVVPEDEWTADNRIVTRYWDENKALAEIAQNVIMTDDGRRIDPAFDPFFYGWEEKEAEDDTVYTVPAEFVPDVFFDDTDSGAIAGRLFDLVLYMADNIGISYAPQRTDRIIVASGDDNYTVHEAYHRDTLFTFDRQTAVAGIVGYNYLGSGNYSDKINAITYFDDKSDGYFDTEETDNAAAPSSMATARAAVDQQGNILFSVYHEDDHVSGLFDPAEKVVYDPFEFWPDGDPDKPPKPGTDNQPDLYNIGIT